MSDYTFEFVSVSKQFHQTFTLNYQEHKQKIIQDFHKRLKEKYRITLKKKTKQ